jgi:hypothetical protein
MSRELSPFFSLPPDLPPGDLPEIIDLRGLEPPEPMEIILTAAMQLGTTGVYIAHLPHIPFPLFPILETRGLQWQVHEKTDGSALVLIRRKNCKPAD